MSNAAEPGLDHPAWFKQSITFSIHILTASGAAFALFALVAAVEWRWAEMFGWLALALAIDAIDGPLARKFKVSQLLPRWSGEVLDLIVDFSTFVLAPAVAITIGGILPQMLEVPAGAAIVISSAIYFADRHMKTNDAYFRGFPATWNFVAFYLFLLRPDPWIAISLVAFLVVLTFVPVVFIHPLRVTRLRPLNIAVCFVWSGLAIFALLRDLSPPTWTTVGLCGAAAYFLIAGFSRVKKT